MGRPRSTATRRSRRRPLVDLAPEVAVVVLGLASALCWGSGDFGGGLVTRRAPVLAVVAVTQGVGAVAALVLAGARGGAFPGPPPLGPPVLPASFGGGGGPPPFPGP